MFELIVKAVSLGLMIAVLVGPVFFLLISTSIGKGFIPALFLAIGIFSCDTLYIVLIYLGFAQFATLPHVSDYMTMVGGIVLIGFGMTMIFYQRANEKAIIFDDNKSNRYKYFLKGFLLNLINPSVCLFWIGSVGIVTARYEGQTNYVVLFFSFTLLTVFLTDMIKIYLAKKISAYLKPITLHRINQISGVAMAIFGLYLIAEKIR